MERSSSRSAGPRPRDWRDVEQVDAAVAMVHSRFATCVAWIASARGCRPVEVRSKPVKERKDRDANLRTARRPQP